MSDDSVYSKGLTNESLPTAIAAEAWGGRRQTRYREPMVQPIGNWRAQRVREQTYFVAQNPINDASTTLAGHPAPLLADADATMTKPFLHLMMPAGSTVHAELDYIEIEVVTAGATATQACWACQVDTGTTRVTTAGTTLTKGSPNGQCTSTGTLQVQGGVVVTGAESSNIRMRMFGTHRPSIEIAGDRYTFMFGRDPVVMQTVAATVIGNFVVNLPAVELGTTDQFLLAMHGQASQNAAGVYKVRVFWSER